ncbi:MAG: lytic transglycosylase domain-containing protein [Deltaproteobacteria bacterium]|nr:lytic transglycosylase domain-containing protein [Deltaproteobacteria bacterium]
MVQLARQLRPRGRALCIIVLAACFVFLGTIPLPGKRPGQTDTIDHAKVERRRETLNIYTIVRSQDEEMSDSLLWEIAELIVDESLKHRFDPMLVLALIQVESRFRHKAVSPEGARGLMQIRPFVAKAIAEELELEKWRGRKSLDDPRINIRIGISYLKYLRDKFGDIKIALAAYKWGPTRVQRRLKSERKLPRNYAQQVLSISRSYRDKLKPVQEADCRSGAVACAQKGVS